jgi:sensor histidine kinase regulating citrate/malate metabolism
VKAKSKRAISSNQQIRREMRALRQAARDARRLSEITETSFIVVKNGRLIDLNKRRKQSAKAKELVKLLRPFGA